MKETIGILGCGWLGTPLAVELLINKHTVKGATTSQDKLHSLSKKGIAPYLIQLRENTIEGDIESFLDKTNTLIVNIPPNLRANPKSDYVAKMAILLDVIKKSTVSNVLLISSTSVYGNSKGKITEKTQPQPSTSSGKQLLEVENLYKNQSSLSTTIIRFSGLIGKDRHPVYQLSGKKRSNGKELINLIHLNDCIHMIRIIIKNGYWNELFNGVYPFHPTKEEYYCEEAQKRGIPSPLYDTHAKNIEKKEIHAELFSLKGHALSIPISL